jgi:hypothetical protein
MYKGTEKEKEKLKIKFIAEYLIHHCNISRASSYSGE